MALPEHLYAIVGTNPEDGIVACEIDGTWFPMVCNGERRLAFFIGQAREIHRQTGALMHVVRYESPTVLRSIDKGEHDH